MSKGEGEPATSMDTRMTGVKPQGKLLVGRETASRLKNRGTTCSRLDNYLDTYQVVLGAYPSRLATHAINACHATQCASWSKEDLWC